jgi:hypothetical protein
MTDPTRGADTVATIHIFVAAHAIISLALHGVLGPS